MACIIARPAPTALPPIIAGSTCLISFTANGIAPSVIPINPIKALVTPSCFSALSYFLREIKVDNANPSGGIATATRNAPFGPYSPSAISAIVNADAVLLMGPPISNAVINPITIPSRIALPPCIPLSISVKAFINAPRGPTRIYRYARAQINADMIGIIRTGIMDLIVGPTFQLLIHLHT